MAETARRLKINRKYESTPCTWCGDALQLGEDGAVCEACDSPHHARCWDERNGCGKEGCPNAPLHVLEEPPPKPEKRLSPDEQLCPTCGDIITGTHCFSCRRSAQAGLYDGEQSMAPELKTALMYAAVGLFCFGLYFGYKAMKSAGEAKVQIEEDSRYSGTALATIVQVVGVAEIALWGIWILVNFARIGIR
jgi:RING finger family protein